MKKASMVAIFITTFFYLCCGCFGYAAFGHHTPGNLLTGLLQGSGFYEPFWLVDLANVCIIIHLLGGYQVILMFHIKHKMSQKQYPFFFIAHEMIFLCLHNVQKILVFI